MQFGIAVTYNVCEVKPDNTNILYYQVLLHTHCKQLGSNLVLYESVYVRSVFLS